ncbi:MAG: lipoyl(octanoyl) transferase LipB [Bdellovibrionales bacterium]|jgi:lipoyl(octanoyl) transferase
MINPKTPVSPFEWKVSTGLVPYEEALAVMDARVDAVLAGGAGELVWLLEHPPLYTAGTSACAEELIDAARFPVYQTGRGGKHTYHGPQQRVVYAVMDLTRRDRDLRAHVWRLEEWVIRTLAAFGVSGGRRKGRVGVWVLADGQDKKIAALGVRARRWVTSHGVAINVNPDLSHFAGIVPCGIKGYGVTSLHDLGVCASMDEVDAALQRQFKGVFLAHKAGDNAQLIENDG